MGDVPRILNMYVQISFVITIKKSFVLVTDLMKNKITVFNFCVELISDHHCLDLTCVSPR